MIISLDAEKAFDEIQHPLMIKILDQSGVQDTYVNIIKAIHIHQTNININNQYKIKGKET